MQVVVANFSAFRGLNGDAARFAAGKARQEERKPSPAWFDNLPMHAGVSRWPWALAMVSALALPAMQGCSPGFNWREARLGTAPLQMLLPCKPDKTQRDVAMGAQTMALEMQGCEAGGVTFAVSHVQAADIGSAPALLEGWKAAVLAHIHASQVEEKSFTPPGGWRVPQSVRLQANGRRADASAVVLYAAWFARVDAAGVHLFHAVMFAPREMPEQAETFFSSLAVP